MWVLPPGAQSSCHSEDWQKNLLLSGVGWWGAGGGGWAAGSSNF